MYYIPINFFYYVQFKTGGLFQYMVIHMNDKLQSDVFLQLRITSCDILVTMLAHDEAMQLTFNQDSKLFISTFLGKFINELSFDPTNYSWGKTTSPIFSQKLQGVFYPTSFLVSVGNRD